ncbi:related to Eukaryotic translation initiation factor 3 subunit M [Ramularia collo-cygni]|uniref:Eukaryotic translation initiation factor 3 subunit M n=1 Tax=Ramularia collo-cygni TaxID=112498 RepID=A0A2D3UTQ5_9PEZI|nr:related to Eukaryotic translation initiation factor 3 subunit M [Ramularia collo-cygni]CZT18398.1 related to Eukaryotic translation initiation factor 3 subunit M [Ramularia collo-cygni]
MPGISKLSLVEGNFEELALELATYLDSAKGEGSTIAADITPLLADTTAASEEREPDSSRPATTDRDAVLKKLVTASSILNGAPERELQAAYNHLIHLIQQAEDPDTYLPHICRYLTAPVTSSPHNGTGIALGILSTLFNSIEPDDESRYHVLLAIVNVIKNSGNYETLAPQLKHVDSWVAEWELEPADARKLYLAVADAAAAANESEQSYTYLLRALRTAQSEPASSGTRDLSVRALKVALQNSKHFDFQDLTALESIQALRKSDATWFELLELFTSENYDDFQDFKEGTPNFLSEQSLDEDILDKKMRLLTLASLAAQASSSRTLPYAHIARALQISPEEVEMWVIDSIRSGLVEGKLSQQKSEFLVHRSTYRVFGDNQWREVASRLETWKGSLNNILSVIRAQKEEYLREKEAELSGSGAPQQGGGGRPWQKRIPERRDQPAAAVEVE